MQGEDTPIKIPKGATHMDVSGICYKKGSHGFTYYYDKKGKEWVRCNRPLKSHERIRFYEN